MNKKRNPKKVQFAIRVTPEQLVRLREKAMERDTSISEFVRSVLDFIMNPVIPVGEK